MDNIATAANNGRQSIVDADITASRRKGFKVPLIAASGTSTIFSRISFLDISKIPIAVHLIVGLIVRLLLIVYGTIQDQRLNVKYTDIDYEVFSDAARHVYHGTGTPYSRETYRYTPLLAYILTPNEFFGSTSQHFGKFLFCLCDLMVGYMQYRMLRPMVGWRLATVSSLLWLYNPIVINISTRGNAESIVALLTVGSLYALIRNRVILSAVLFGLAIHFKLYPICYAPALVLFLSRRHHVCAEYFWKGGSASAAVAYPAASVHSSKSNGTSPTSAAERRITTAAKRGAKNSIAITPIRGGGSGDSTVFTTPAAEQQQQNARFAAHSNYVFSPLTRQSVHKRTNNAAANGETVLKAASTKACTTTTTGSVHEKIQKFFLGLTFWTRHDESSLALLPTLKQIEFVVVAIATFSLFTGMFYLMYGMQFLNEAILYHFSRKDMQHNFSWWFYIMRWLHHGSSADATVPKTYGNLLTSYFVADRHSKFNLAASFMQFAIAVVGFVPQMIGCAVVNWKFRSSPLHAAFFATFLFVMLNKVCTVQYFVWYMAFLPFVFVSLEHLSTLAQLALVGQWLAAHGHWLYQAYKYEFLKQHDNLFTVWLGSLWVLVANLITFGVCYQSVRRCRYLAIAYRRRRDAGAVDDNLSTAVDHYAETSDDKISVNGWGATNTQREPDNAVDVAAAADDYGLNVDTMMMLEGPGGDSMVAETEPYLIAQKWAHLFKADLPDVSNAHNKTKMMSTGPRSTTATKVGSGSKKQK